MNILEEGLLMLGKNTLCLPRTAAPRPSVGTQCRLLCLVLLS